ncbi:MAG: hypothetical protein AAFV45_07565 [Pseudomonadota bacterium]
MFLKVVGFLSLFAFAFLALGLGYYYWLETREDYFEITIKTKRPTASKRASLSLR